MIMSKTKISETFFGWDENETYYLDDGSEWRLAAPDFTLASKFRPPATVSRRGASWFLSVQGCGRRKVICLSAPYQDAPVVPPAPRDSHADTLYRVHRLVTLLTRGPRSTKRWRK